MTGTSFKEIIYSDAFKKDLKRLQKRFKTLDEDMDTFIASQLQLYHKLNIDNKGIFEIKETGFSEPTVFKAKKFACRSLKGKGVKSGIRAVYAYFREKDRIEFIEIYFKGDRENEDRERLKELTRG
ncbi:MAG: hypothetical protein GY754_02960 [bacterium]|nr:hypothetical protein [bacterium]